MLRPQTHSARGRREKSAGNRYFSFFHYSVQFAGGIGFFFAKDGTMKTRAASSSRPRLSVAMIVRDEQDVLADSIQSVCRLADEIVVLDTGSVDRTPQLAAEMGAAVHHKPWDSDFAAARNHCLRFVSGDWVLWMDAGETLVWEDADRLRTFVNKEAIPAAACSVMIEIPPRDEGASAEQVAQLRLFPARSGLRYAGRVRETVEESLAAAGIAIVDAPFRIDRHKRQHDPDRLLAKARRDLALATAEAEAIGKWPPRLLLAAGQAHSVLGRQDEARESLRRAIESAPIASPQRLEAYYSLLTTFDDDPEMHASQLTACLDSLEDFPFDLQLLLALGNYMLVRERLDLGIRAFDAAVRFGRITPTVWHLREAREIAAVCLSLALQARQRDDEARDVLETALAARPDSFRLASQLHTLYRAQGKTAEAAAMVGRLPAEVRENIAWPGEEESGYRLRIDSAQGMSAFSPHLAVPQPQPIDG
jgi:tetratricopeptide (TPR) repeat protein